MPATVEQISTGPATANMAGLVAELVRLAGNDLSGLSSCLKELGPSKPLEGKRITCNLRDTDPSVLLFITLQQLGAEIGYCPALDGSMYLEGLLPSRVAYWLSKADALDCGPDMIVDHHAELTLMVSKGVKAEEEFEKTGNLPDLTSISDPVLRAMLSVIAKGLPINPKKYHKIKNGLIGVCDTTTLGVKLLYQMQADGTLPCPAININGSLTKIKSGSCDDQSTYSVIPVILQKAHLNSLLLDVSEKAENFIQGFMYNPSQALDNGWGTFNLENQSEYKYFKNPSEYEHYKNMLESENLPDYADYEKLNFAMNKLRTSLRNHSRGISLVIGSKVVVCGYGDKGRRAADAMKKAGAHVFITEINPIPAYQATQDGFEVLNWEDIYPRADYIITATAKKNTITVHDMKKMKNNTIIIDYGSFDNEINIVELEGYPGVEKIFMPNGYKWVFPETKKGILVMVLPDGGPTSDVQTMTLVALTKLAKENETGKYRNEVHVVPKETVEYVAMLHLQQAGAKLTMEPTGSSCAKAALDGQTYLGKRKAGLFNKLTLPKTKSKGE